MGKILGWIVRLLWIAICMAALVMALGGYQSKSDWKEEEGLAFEMILSGFPGSLLVVLGFMLIGFVLERFGVSLPPPSQVEMLATWLIFVVAGYIQWFFLMPMLVRSWRNSRTKRANPN